MDIHITEINTGERFTLCMLPEKTAFSGSTAFQSYDIINIGEVKIPKGVDLLEFDWSGILPGESRKNASFVKTQYWISPDKVLATWEKWRKNGSKLKLMITETPINYDVCLDSYSAEATGSAGDYEYKIKFVESKDIKIFTTAELGLVSTAIVIAARPAAAQAAAPTYTVVKGDCLWKIAQKKLGNGNRWREIYNLNKDKIKNPDLIFPGQVFTLPG